MGDFAYVLYPEQKPAEKRYLRWFVPCFKSFKGGKCRQVENLKLKNEYYKERVTKKRENIILYLSFARDNQIKLK